MMFIILILFKKEQLTNRAAINDDFRITPEFGIFFYRFFFVLFQKLINEKVQNFQNHED